MTGLSIATLFMASALAGVDAEVNVSNPWVAQESDAGLWTFSHPQHRGVLTLQISNPIGLNLSYQNRTLHTQTQSKVFPLISVPFSVEEATKIKVENQGIDLVIHLEGPTLKDWLDDESAPATQSVLSWIRVRIRGEKIRFVLTGAHRWTLPASEEGPYPTPDDDGGLSFNHGFGHWHYTSTAKGRIGAKDRERWYLDWSPSIEMKDPYPETIVEWSPSLDTQRP